MRRDVYQERLLQVERRVRRLSGALVAVLLLLLASMGGLIAARVPASSGPEGVMDSLRVRSLSVVDERGVERVRISAPLPDPIMLGRRHARGGAVSGILLFDAEGNERSGYVTGDGFPNVLFTLDDIARQRVLFLTEPQGATSLWVSAPNRNMFRLGVTPTSAYMLLQQHGDTIFDAVAPDTALGGS